MAKDGTIRVLSALPRLFAAAMLLGALGEHPYSYYQFLRLIVCAVACYVGYWSEITGYRAWLYVFGGIAVLFNPLIPIHLSRSTWQPIDVITALLFIASIGFIHHNPKASRAVPDDSTRTTDTEDGELFDE